MQAGVAVGSSGIGLFDLAEQRLAWVDRRQELLAQNVANADTPGYRPRDLAPFAALLTGAPLAVSTTDPRHLAGRSAAAAANIAAGELAPDGNGVKLDEELAKVADTDTTQSLVTGLYSKYLGLFRDALGH